MKRQRMGQPDAWGSPTKFEKITENGNQADAEDGTKPKDANASKEATDASTGKNLEHADQERSPRRMKKVTPSPTQKPPDGESIPNERGRSCLFHVIAQGLEDVRPKEKVRTHRRIRLFLTAYLKKKRELFEKRWDGNDHRGNATNIPLEDYVNQLAFVGTWAGKLEARALAEALNLRLVIFTCWGEIIELNPEGAQTIFALLFFFEPWALGVGPRGGLAKLDADEVDCGLTEKTENKRLRGGVQTSATFAKATSPCKSRDST